MSSDNNKIYLIFIYYIMKTLEKFIDFISVLLYGTQKSVTQKHF